MKTLHTILTAAGFLGSAAGVALLGEVSPMLACALLLAASILQIPALVLGSRKSAVFKLPISQISLILLLCDMLLCTLTLLAAELAVYPLPITLLAGAVALIPKAIPTDFDPTGEDFVTSLTEALETISRATAERRCGFDTQLLYEQARFCEPLQNPSVRMTEREILRRILDIKPYDSDAEISAKCAAVSELLQRREKITN